MGNSICADRTIHDLGKIPLLGVYDARMMRFYSDDRICSRASGVILVARKGLRIPPTLLTISNYPDAPNINATRPSTCKKCGEQMLHRWDQQLDDKRETVREDDED
jgi:hypothetical protein